MSMEIGVGVLKLILKARKLCRKKSGKEGENFP